MTWKWLLSNVYLLSCSWAWPLIKAGCDMIHYDSTSQPPWWQAMSHFINLHLQVFIIQCQYIILHSSPCLLYINRLTATLSMIQAGCDTLYINTDHNHLNRKEDSTHLYKTIPHSFTAWSYLGQHKNLVKKFEKLTYTCMLQKKHMYAENKSLVLYVQY